MGDPFTNEKTWLFNVNQFNAAGANRGVDSQNILYTIVNTLRTIGAGALWTVKLSSNSVTSGAADYWTLSTNLVWVNNSGNHSWIVLHNTNGFEILFDCIYGNGEGMWNMAASLSPSGGYAGGTISTAPTASDSTPFLISGGATWRWIDLTTTPGKASRTHVTISNDGQCTRIVVYAAGTKVMAAIIDMLANVSPGGTPWSPPVAVYWPQGATGGSTPLTWAVLGATNWSANYNAIGYGPNATLAGAALTTECPISGNPIPQLASGVPNDISASYQGQPCSFGCASAGFRGRQGRFYDMWIGSTAVADGDTYPASGTLYQFAQFDHLIIPWDSTNAVLKS